MALFGFGRSKNDRNDRMTGKNENTAPETEKEEVSISEEEEAQAADMPMLDPDLKVSVNEEPEKKAISEAEEKFAETAPDPDYALYEFCRNALRKERLYMVHSALTKQPFVESGKDGTENRVYLFTEKQDADNCVMVLELGENPTVVLPFLRSQYAGMAGSLYMMGIDTVILNYEGSTETIPLEKLARRRNPEEIPKEKRPISNPKLELSMMYLIQEIRKKGANPDRAKRATLERAMVLQMIPATFLLPVKQTETEDGKRQIGLMALRDEKSGNMHVPLFTDVPEFLRFLKGKKDPTIKLLPNSFAQLAALRTPEDSKGFIVNPATTSVQVSHEYVRNTVKQIAEQQKKMEEIKAAAQGEQTPSEGGNEE